MSRESRLGFCEKLMRMWISTSHCAATFKSRTFGFFQQVLDLTWFIFVTTLHFLLDTALSNKIVILFFFYFFSSVSCLSFVVCRWCFLDWRLGCKYASEGPSTFLVFKDRQNFEVSNDYGSQLI